MKKIIIGLILLVLSLGTFWGCGGGAGSPSSPSGENHGVPSIVQLQPSHSIAQTNTSITLHAKVLDGNGAPVSNTLVTFTNLSPIGVLSSTTAKTNNTGIATVTLKSTTDGFSTVQAEVSRDVGLARDRKTVFFSSINVGQPVPTLDLTVSGHGDPFVLFEPGVSNDDEVTVTATVFDGFGRRVAGIDVLFGSDSSEATFPLGSTVSSDTNGQASVLVKVVPSVLRALPTTINITALAANGAFNMVSLTLAPISISKVSVSATPTIVAPDGTSTITAAVTITTGGPAPDGTTVNFTATCGVVTPFAQTTNGAATADFTAPSTPGSCTISAISGGIPGSVTVVVAATPAKLTVVPGTESVIAGVGGKLNFTISGGTAPYTTTSSNPSKSCNSTDSDCIDATDTGVWTGSPITVTVPATATPEIVTLTVFDAVGATVSAKITITCTNSPSISPTSASICEIDNTCSAGTTTQLFTITGGTAPYTVTSGTPAVITSPGALAGLTFTVDAIDNSIAADTTVTLTLRDNGGCPATATVTVINQ